MLIGRFTEAIIYIKGCSSCLSAKAVQRPHRIVDDVPGVGNQLVELPFVCAIPRPGGAKRVHLCEAQQYSIFQ